MSLREMKPKKGYELHQIQVNTVTGEVLLFKKYPIDKEDMHIIRVPHDQLRAMVDVLTQEDKFYTAHTDDDHIMYLMRYKNIDTNEFMSNQN